MHTATGTFFLYRRLISQHQIIYELCATITHKWAEEGER